ncbi:DUF2065 domain-containing protein [Colwellia sp. 39_35_sub15_T18]|nr:DUF2065 domain-containing protein [Colwellia sp. 39_35_sub15_T18]
MTEVILAALGIVLIIEGIGPALFPNRWRNYLLRVAKESVSNLRTMGMIMLLLGIALLILK